MPKPPIGALKLVSVPLQLAREIAEPIELISAATTQLEKATAAVLQTLRCKEVTELNAGFATRVDACAVLGQRLTAAIETLKRTTDEIRDVQSAARRASPVKGGSKGRIIR